MLVLRTSNFQGATIRPIVPRQKHSLHARESLGEFDKAVETLASGSCSHSIFRFPKLPFVFL